MWAFIFVDLNKNKIIISRDRFSIKPLFYFKSKHKVYFASEIKQLLPLVHNIRIDENVMYKYLQQGLSILVKILFL